MAQPFPYTYYSCDCYDSKTTSVPAKRTSQPPPTENQDEDEDERTFDPRNPRSNYSLYPLEHLLYCEDCQQIRCPRCVTEETQNWYCPNCLFEVPSSVVRSDGNRCLRNCYTCPICTSNMIVSSMNSPEDASSLGGPFILACPYCRWSTLETGIEFEKSTSITTQLSKIANGGKPIPDQKERERERERRKELENRKSRDILSVSEDSATPDKDRSDTSPSHDELFSNMAAFYKSQITAQASSNPFSPHELSFSSPSFSTRLINLYSSTSAKKQKRERPSPMREAASPLEGLAIHEPAIDAKAIERIKKAGWSATLSSAQKAAQPDPTVRFVDEVRPLATLLCTKRGKRCRSCRQIISKPESKVTSTRFKIKLLALAHIPRLSLRALSPGSPANHTSSLATPAFDYDHLRSGIPTHFLLHLSNPLFDPIRVTLATPSTTTGKVQSRVTILCPQFEVGANTDVWDDALSSSLAPINRSSVLGADGQIEAGKIWDRGRNWTSVVLEVIPGFLKPILGSNVNGQDDDGEIDEDEDVLEIPVFVRLEFEADVHAEDRGLGDSRGSKGEREKREEAFWTVVGVGRIAPM